MAVLILAGAPGRFARAQAPSDPVATTPDKPAADQQGIEFRTRFAVLSLEDVRRLQQAATRLDEPAKQLVDQLADMLDAAAPGRKTSIGSAVRVLSNEKLAALLRVLGETKEFDLLSAPRVTAKSGQKATVNVICEMKYPAVFERTPGADGQFVMVPPKYPSFETFWPAALKQTPEESGHRNIGVVMEVGGTLAPSRDAVDLNVSWQATNVDGFVRASDGQALPIHQPETGKLRTVFATQSIAVSLTVPPDATVVLSIPPQRATAWNDDPDRPPNPHPVEKVIVTFVTPSLVSLLSKPSLLDTEEEEVVAPLPAVDP